MNFVYSSNIIQYVSTTYWVLTFFFLINKKNIVICIKSLFKLTLTIEYLGHTFQCISILNWIFSFGTFLYNQWFLVILQSIVHLAFLLIHKAYIIHRACTIDWLLVLGVYSKSFIVKFKCFIIAILSSMNISDFLENICAKNTPILSLINIIRFIVKLKGLLMSFLFIIHLTNIFESDSGLYTIFTFGSLLNWQRSIVKSYSLIKFILVIINVSNILDSVSTINWLLSLCFFIDS